MGCCRSKCQLFLYCQGFFRNLQLRFLAKCRKDRDRIEPVMGVEQKEDVSLERDAAPIRSLDTDDTSVSPSEKV